VTEEEEEEKDVKRGYTGCSISPVTCLKMGCHNFLLSYDRNTNMASRAGNMTYGAPCRSTCNRNKRFGNTEDYWTMLTFLASLAFSASFEQKMIKYIYLKGNRRDQL
jgi:hypothetical protein